MPFLVQAVASAPAACMQPEELPSDFPSELECMQPAIVKEIYSELDDLTGGTAGSASVFGVGAGGVGEVQAGDTDEQHDVIDIDTDQGLLNQEAS